MNWLIGVIAVIVVFYMFNNEKITMPKVFSDNKLVFGLLGGFTLCWFMKNDLIEGLGERCNSNDECISENCVDSNCGPFLPPQGATCEQRCDVNGHNWGAEALQQTEFHERDWDAFHAVPARVSACKVPC